MTIRHARGGYEVHSVPAESALAGLPASSFLVTDQNVHRAWGRVVPGGVPVWTVRPGEASKDMAILTEGLRWLAAQGARRDATVVAFGGGVVGDLAGFMAAAYMRGVAILQVPTSLLAMVDSSVGGKVGVDLPEGKNLVGAFWPPKEVRIASGFLATLPEREFRCGAAEVWKTAWIGDPGLLAELESAPLAPGDPRLDATIEACVRFKAAVVEEDEHETTGRRAVLNFGHTVGHAIEAAMGYEGVTHGEAVAIGMVVESRLAERLRLAEPGLADRVARGLASQGLPTMLPARLDIGVLVALMASDKKRSGSGLSFSLTLSPGECKLVHGVAREDVAAVLADE
jgi:3-dehydroquinate synthase